MTEMKEKTKMTKEENVNDHRSKSPKVKSPSSTPAEVKGVEQLPDKVKLQQSPKNTVTEPNQEVKGDNKQNELSSQTGKQQPLLSKPKAGKKAEEKSELKCKPLTSPNTSAKEPTKDLGVEVKIHQETAKVEESLTDTSSERRESESASSGGAENDARQCTGTAPEKTRLSEASKELPTQDEMIIGKLFTVTLENFEIFVLPLCVIYNIHIIYTMYAIIVGAVLRRPLCLTV